eukprot:1195990-Prorocentrum_minimum.AAC.7
MTRPMTSPEVLRMPSQRGLRLWGRLRLTTGSRGVQGKGVEKEALMASWVTGCNTLVGLLPDLQQTD